MKQLKGELTAFQKESKELKDHPEKAMEVQKKMMATNSKYMMQSFKPQLISMLPLLVIFWWMNAHFAYMPIGIGQEFPMTVSFSNGVYGNMTIDAPDSISVLSEKTRVIENGQLTWLLKANQTGEYLIEFDMNSKIYSTNVKISEKAGDYDPVLKPIGDSSVKQIAIGNKKNIMLDLGIIKLDWFWSYLIMTLIFSSLLRKWMKVY
jgi:uncharacterized membrane protein (DUF106 family)